MFCAGESVTGWPYPVGSSLLYLYGQGFKVRQDYVYEENGEQFNSSILYTGSSIDAATGGLTGTDGIGAIWFGKLRIGNSGFLRSGDMTFGTRSDDGSVTWIDLDQDGDFSTSGLKGNEMIVNNLGSHGQRDRTSTLFLGYKAPFAMRSGNITKPGIFAGTKGLSTAQHATEDGENLAIGSEQMRAGAWNHLVMVINREEGKLQHFLNGRLVGEDDFPEDEVGTSYKSDWFIGGFSSLNKFAGWIDELRFYSKALNDYEISSIYNWGSGDMGVTGKIDAPFVTDQSPIPVTLEFLKFENPVEVGGPHLR